MFTSISLKKINVLNPISIGSKWKENILPSIRIILMEGKRQNNAVRVTIIIEIPLFHIRILEPACGDEGLLDCAGDCPADEVELAAGLVVGARLA